MIALSLTFADQASAIAALAAHGIAAKNEKGDAIIPSTAITPGGVRVDINVAGGGSGVILAPTGATAPGPSPDPSTPGAPLPVYAPAPGFHLDLLWSGPTAPDFGAAVNLGATPAFIGPGAPAPAPVPSSVALWQARAALTTAGLFSQADAAIRASGNAGVIALWDYGNMISRSSPTLAALGTALGLTDAQIDALFIQAAAISL